MRYRLDDLGWFNFEAVMQSALKAEFGLLIEAWGGSGDFGRDAYCPIDVVAGDTKIEGPIIFQAKFVQNANSAGANWIQLLRNAVAKEIGRTRERQQTAEWVEPRTYFLYTNAPLNRVARASILKMLRRQLPTVAIHLNGGHDVCAILDLHPELRRSFPELLGLRDLDILLKSAVNAHVLQRSLAAISETRDLVPVFVPTAAYDHTWRVLEKHSFAVLDGPPEMGKTAIARTVAMGHLLVGWQAIDCRRPGDFFASYDGEASQIFVADDAFGRTEFDPTLANEWERDLPKILHRLDHRHRLIWTTRKHILQRALFEMDLSGKARHFPDPGEIVVIADDLSTEERARILYRHSKLIARDAGRDAIKKSAKQLVTDKHFTPERIRRLVADVIPELLSTQADDGAITAALVNAIRNPTDRMRKSFRKLSDNHQWLLISMLGLNPFSGTPDLATSFRRFKETTEKQFEQLLDEVLGTFLKLRTAHGHTDRVDWIHPSYRDLVIEELAERSDRRGVFIRNASVTELGLAVSEAGGAQGERSLPLIPDAEAAELVAYRARELAGEEASLIKIAIVLNAIAPGMRDPTAPSEVVAPLRTVADEIARSGVDSVNAQDDLMVYQLVFFVKAVVSVGLTYRPHVADLWRSTCERMTEELDSFRTPDAEDIEEWGDLRNIITDEYPTFSQSDEFRVPSAKIAEGLLDVMEGEFHNRPDPSDPEENGREADRIDSLADALEHVEPFGSYGLVIKRLESLAADFHSNRATEPDLSYERGNTSQKLSFDIETFFLDL